MNTDQPRGSHPPPGSPSPCSPAERGAKLTQLRLGKTNSRRGFKVAAAAGAVAGAAGCDLESWDEFLQDHYLRRSNGDKKVIFERLEKQTKRQTGVDVTITDPHPLEGVEFAYALNLSACNGNRRCVSLRPREQPPEQPRDPLHPRPRDAGGLLRPRARQLAVHRHGCPSPAVLPAGAVPPVPHPRLHQGLPTGATWKEPDGIVVVDYNWCIGCRYCQAACPYHARRFNFAPPTVEPDHINPHMGYLSNRLRMIGVVEKCTFCLQRTRDGQYPACMEVCPTGARKFGNLADPESEIRHIIETKRVYILMRTWDAAALYYFFT